MHKKIHAKGLSTQAGLELEKKSNGGLPGTEHARQLPMALMNHNENLTLIYRAAQ